MNFLNNEENFFNFESLSWGDSVGCGIISHLSKDDINKMEISKSNRTLEQETEL